MCTCGGNKMAFRRRGYRTRSRYSRYSRRPIRSRGRYRSRRGSGRSRTYSRVIGYRM